MSLADLFRARRHREVEVVFTKVTSRHNTGVDMSGHETIRSTLVRDPPSAMLDDRRRSSMSVSAVNLWRMHLAMRRRMALWRASMRFPAVQPKKCMQKNACGSGIAFDLY